MSPRPGTAWLSGAGFPRVSGDEPPWKPLTLRSELFSPRERG